MLKIRTPGGSINKNGKEVKLSMLKYITLLIFITASPLFAFEGAIEGRVSDSKNAPLSAAQVWLEGYQSGDATDDNGRYSIEVPKSGEFKVIYQYIGFTPETLIINVLQGQKVRKDVILKESAIRLNEIRVSGRKETIYNPKTPEPTVVIPREAAERAGASTVGQAIELETGAKLQSKCSMCAASEISLQGLPGRFSLILLDGMPIFSGLASKYILDIFPIDFMDNVQVLKGASGAIRGSDAIAGAVNIILPQPSEYFKTKASYTRHNLGNDFSGTLSNSLKSLGITAMAARSDRSPVDLNGDSVSENTSHLRDIFLSTLVITPPSLLYDFTFGGSLAKEARKGGAMVPDSEFYTNPDAERVTTERWDLWHQTRIGFGSKSLKLKAAVSSNGEDGVIDTRDYSADQQTTYGELSTKFEKLTTGVSISKEDLSDTRLFGSYEENDYGIWSSLENKFSSVNLLTAARVDLNSDYGNIFSPYGAVKSSVAGLDINIAAGTGFRTPSLIFESVGNLPAGYRYAIRRDSNLTKESSISLEAGLGKKFVLSNSASDFRLNFFRHRVSDFINARFEGLDSATDKAIFYYYNLGGTAVSTGAELSAAFTISDNFDLRISGFALSPTFSDSGTLPFVNKWGTNYSATYENADFELNMVGRLNGPMFIQTVYNTGLVKDSYSPAYNTLNLSGAKNIGSFKVTLGVNNIFDYYQPPLTNAMTEYSWGPIIGREIYARISVEFGQVSSGEDESGKAKDLVCGMTVNKNGALKTAYKGKSYYFCSEDCEEKFVKEPGKYINNSN